MRRRRSLAHQKADQALRSRVSAGLHELGPWSTVYVGLSSLGEPRTFLSTRNLMDDSIQIPRIDECNPPGRRRDATLKRSLNKP